jgi:hypothetical protein
MSHPPVHVPVVVRGVCQVCGKKVVPVEFGPRKGKYQHLPLVSASTFITRRKAS